MASQARKRIDLALQGGGAHGAFTWGVLDRLLEDERLEIEAISGTSAGAMNAVALADGLQDNGRDGARQKLHDFWQAVSEAARTSPIQRGLWERLTGNYSLDSSPSYLFFDHLTRLFSPYDLNPLDIDPLRDLVAERIDFDRVNACSKIDIHVTATNIRTGQARVFSRGELSVSSVMASACLPFIFKAVEIDGEAYWDGGYSGNPALHPLVDSGPCRDMMIVQINPIVRTDIPHSARDILNRMNEITFNASLIKELRVIHLLHRLIDAGGLESERYRDMRIHIIHADEELQSFSASSKMNAEWSYLSLLRDRGRHWASAWLEANFDAIGERSTFDLDVLFEGSIRPPGPGLGKTPAEEPVCPPYEDGPSAASSSAASAAAASAAAASASNEAAGPETAEKPSVGRSGAVHSSGGRGRRGGRRR